MIHTSNSRQHRGLTDEQLIRQVWPSQPSQCMELLYNRYAPKVYSRCCSMTNNLDTAHDFTQDIFLKVFARLDTFQGRARFSTWLYCLTTNYCIDQIRARKRCHFVGVDPQAEHQLVDSEPDSLQEERLQFVSEAMTKLPLNEQLVLRLYYEARLKVSEIANLYGLHPTTIKMQLHRSRVKIQRLVGSSRLRSG